MIGKNSARDATLAFFCTRVNNERRELLTGFSECRTMIRNPLPTHGAEMRPGNNGLRIAFCPKPSHLPINEIQKINGKKITILVNLLIK